MNTNVDKALDALIREQAAQILFDDIRPAFVKAGYRAKNIPELMNKLKPDDWDKFVRWKELRLNQIYYKLGVPLDKLNLSDLMAERICSEYFPIPQFEQQQQQQEEGSVNGYKVFKENFERLKNQKVMSLSPESNGEEFKQETERIKMELDQRQREAFRNQKERIVNKERK